MICRKCGKPIVQAGRYGWVHLRSGDRRCGPSQTHADPRR